MRDLFTRQLTNNNFSAAPLRRGVFFHKISLPLLSTGKRERFMNKLNLALKPALKSDLPVRVLQFGEGNFLRGFIDWMVAKMNQKGLFNGRIAVVQPTTRGRVLPKLEAQNYLYTTILHGIRDGRAVEECEILNVLSEGYNPYSNWQNLLELAKSKDLKFIFSNTTEAGVTYQKEEGLSDEVAPLSFPGKLTAFLYKRFTAFSESLEGSGLVILPCELLDDNGTMLKNIVLRHIDDWGLGDEFKAYVEKECRFLNTLVDRVVSGYPLADAPHYEEKFGYQDELMTAGEIFGFMAIEGGDDIKELLPFEKAGLNVVVAPDISPYRLRKVRILNGGHTSSVPAAFLAGIETVDEMMEDEVIGPFVHSVVFDEIIPAVNLDKQMLTGFAEDVVNRFKNKSMHHRLLDILMNSTSKVKARILPTILDARAKGQLPMKLCFSLAAYLALYRNAVESPVTVTREKGMAGAFRDDEYAVEVLKNAWSHYQGTEASALFTVKAVLSDIKLWDRDLSSDVDLTAATAKLAHAIVKDGVKKTMQDLQS